MRNCSFNIFVMSFANSVIQFFGSSVCYPAMVADHPLAPECHDDQQRLEDAEFSRRRGRTESTASSQWEGIPIGNGPRKI